MRALVFALAMLPVAAWARQPALHDIPWYKAHDQERAVTLRMCHNNQTLQLASDDCANAERADATEALRGNGKDPLSYLDNPAYWSQNPLSRTGVLNACQHPEQPGNQMWLRYCAPARASAGGGR